MRVKLEEPGLMGEIASFLSSCDCEVRQASMDVIEIAFNWPEASRDRMRLEAYLRIWNALHPGGRAVFLDDAGVAA